MRGNLDKSKQRQQADPILQQIQKGKEEQSMPKQVIINMKEVYPFGQCSQGDDQTVKVLVRKSLTKTTQSSKLLQRAQYFKRLNQNCIINLQQILQQQQCIDLLYEYVPIRMQTWISNINQKFIQSFCKQLIQLGQYLAKCYINVVLTLENVGMDENYRPKYFLDLDFELNQDHQKNALRNNYHQQILHLFRPYVQNKIIPRPIRFREGSDVKNQLSPSKALALKNFKADNYSTSSTIRLKEKAVALQKQRKNQSINVLSSKWDMMPDKNRKQSILSSVSNVKINRFGRRIEEIKSKLRNIYSPEPIYLKHEERRIEKNPNSIAFNWDSTERVIGGSSSLNQEAIQPKHFAKSIMRDLQQDESIFQKFQKNLAKQLTKGLPMKKNETLKAKQYEQMKQSDDGYFKDFFQVLEDKPKNMAIEHRRSPAIQYEPLESNEHQNMLAIEPEQSKPKAEKTDLAELQNRVKNVINKSKKLINKFKNDK